MGDHHIQVPIIDRLHEETMTMLIEARNYCACKLRVEICDRNPFAKLEIYGEAMRVTSRLAWIVSWWACRKAFEAGEMSTDEIDTTDDQGSIAAWSNSGDSGRLELPAGLEGLLDRSQRLFIRTMRIDQLN